MTAAKIDRIAEIAIWVSVIAVTLSASAITWSVSRMKSMQAEVNELRTSAEVCTYQGQKVDAYLRAHGIIIE